MYSAKRGDSNYFFYDPGSDAMAAEELKLSGWLRKALENNEFHLHFQPKVEIGSDRISGVEALLRWKHPRRGMIPPAEFIPIAEQNGMITPITDWVLTEALKQCKRWRHCGLNLPVAINVSARSFQNPALVEKVQDALNRAGLAGECLQIEITENTLVADLEHGAEILVQLAKLGVRIAIDDFGPRYSSLSYLKCLPINTVKIDKSFILDMAHDDNDRAIVRSIIGLGRNLGFCVLAEGVENADTWTLLENWGCDAAQGYHVSRPILGHDLNQWISQTETRWRPSRCEGDPE
jgi:EAL domain-containing protein (putative c-di-GMP-specific phosphodiesterase class I)